MADQSRGRGRRLAGARSFVGRRTRTQKAAGLAGVVLLATAPFGGLEPAPTPAPAGIVAGQAFEIGPYEVTVKKVVTVPDLAPAVSPEHPGDRLLVLDLLVRNPGTRPEYSTLLSDAVSVAHGGVVATSDRPGRGTDPRPDLYLVADGTRPSVLNPGLTYEIAFVFEQQAGWAGHDVTLRVRGYEFMHEDPLTLDADYWLLQDDVVRRADLPVEVRS